MAEDPPEPQLSYIGQTPGTATPAVTATWKRRLRTTMDISHSVPSDLPFPSRLFTIHGLHDSYISSPGR
jgi:hypothetical protein